MTTPLAENLSPIANELANDPETTAMNSLTPDPKTQNHYSKDAPLVVDTIMDELDFAWRNWVHADQLRQSRNQNYITLNSIFVAAGGLTLSNNDHFLRYMPIALIASILALTICFVWRGVLIRNSEFQRYFRMQALELEHKRGYTTLTGYNNALYKQETVHFPFSENSFSLRKNAGIMNADRENLLPQVFIAFWVFSVAGSAFGTYLFLHST